MPDSNAVVTKTSKGFRLRLPQWTKVRDALEGEDAIKIEKTAYLPKPTGMKQAQYDAYVERASFFGMSERTLRGISGLVFRVQPVTVVPDAIQRITEVATPEGFTLNQTAREAVNETLSIGRYGVLVDMTTNESNENVPYLATYKAEAITRWEEVTTDGIRHLTRVVVREEPETSGDTTTRFLRELFINEDGVYQQNVYQEVTTDTTSDHAIVVRGDLGEEYLTGSYELVDFVIPTKNGVPFQEIPFWFINVFDTRPRPVKPPFLDMVNMNIAHYRNSADYEQSLFMTSQPTPYIFGIPPDDVPTGIGAGVMWTSSSRDVDAGFIEFSGPGIESLERAMRFKEDRMAAIGARIILDVERADNVTAETTRLQTRAETSVMVGAVSTVEEVFTAALAFAAEWAGASGEDVSFSLNQDFIETRLSPQEMTALVATWQAGAISRETLHGNLQRGEIVSPDREVEEEVALTDAEAEERAEKAAEIASQQKKLDPGAESSSDVSSGAGDSGTSESE